MPTLEARVDGEILWITLNRPGQLNALNRELVDALHELFTDLNRRRDVRLVVLQGAGNSFCAGLDLKETAGSLPSSTGETLDNQRRIAEIVLAMRRCPQPIIAMVQGAACGGGFALALASDIRIGAPDARMNAAFIRIGLSACDIGVSYFLPRMVGSSVASEYMLTGRFIDATRATHLGLFSKVVSIDQFEPEARALASEILRASPLGLRLTKDALNHAIDAAGLEATMAIEDRNQMLAAKDENFREGLAAFLEKRIPNYRR